MDVQELVALLAFAEQEGGTPGAGPLVVALHDGADPDEIVNVLRGYGFELTAYFLRELLVWTQLMTSREDAADPAWNAAYWKQRFEREVG